MNQETINQLKTIFEPIAQKIGQGAEFGWEVVVRQQIIIGIIGIVITILFAIMMYFLLKFFQKNKNNEEIGETATFHWLLSVIVVLSVIVMSATQGILHLLNPSYYAIQFFLNLVK